jgi:hypothetical protein
LSIYFDGQLCTEFSLPYPNPHATIFSFQVPRWRSNSVRKFSLHSLHHAQQLASICSTCGALQVHIICTAHAEQQLKQPVLSLERADVWSNTGRYGPNLTTRAFACVMTFYSTLSILGFNRRGLCVSGWVTLHGNRYVHRILAHSSRFTLT